MKPPADSGVWRPAATARPRRNAYSRTSTTSFRSSRCAGFKVIWS
jgi:hypothetical protein